MIGGIDRTAGKPPTRQEQLPQEIFVVASDTWREESDHEQCSRVTCGTNGWNNCLSLQADLKRSRERAVLNSRCLLCCRLSCLGKWPKKCRELGECWQSRARHLGQQRSNWRSPATLGGVRAVPWSFLVFVRLQLAESATLFFNTSLFSSSFFFFFLFFSFFFFLFFSFFHFFFSFLCSFQQTRRREDRRTKNGANQEGREGPPTGGGGQRTRRRSPNQQGRGDDPTKMGWRRRQKKKKQKKTEKGEKTHKKVVSLSFSFLFLSGLKM